MENTWYLTDRDDNATSTATKAAEPGSSHVITGIHAGYSAAATKTLVIKEGSTAKITLNVVNQMDLSDVEIPLTAGEAITVELAASGTGGVYGGFLVTGYTK